MDNFMSFEQAIFETIAEEMNTTPEAIRDDFIKFSAEINKLVEKGYSEEEAEMTVAANWEPTYLQ